MTADTLLPPVLIAAAVCCGLMAGLFFAFSACVMRALGRLPTAGAIAAMQAINAAILNPLLALLFFGSALACALVVILSAVQAAPGGGVAMSGGIAYLVGGLSVTFAFNVPMNNRLATLDPLASESSSQWADYLRSWTRWNHLRTISSLASTLLLALAIGQHAAR